MEVCMVCRKNAEKPIVIKGITICEGCDETLYEHYEEIVGDNLDREPCEPMYNEGYD